MPKVSLEYIEKFREQVTKCLAVGGDMLVCGYPGCGKTYQAIKLWQSEKSPAHPAHYYCLSEEKTGQRQTTDLLNALHGKLNTPLRISALRSAVVRSIADQIVEQKTATLLIDQFELATPEFFDDILHAKKQAQIQGQQVSLLFFNQIIPGSGRIHPRIIPSNKVSMLYTFPYLSPESVANLLGQWFKDECAEIKKKFFDGDEEAQHVVRLITSQLHGRFDYMAQFAAMHKKVYPNAPWSLEKVREQIGEFSGLEPALELRMD